MTDTTADRGLTVTIKVPESARYRADNPWLVFHGSPQQIREDIIAAFGLIVEGEPSLFDLTLQAQSIASGIANAARTLGATSAPANEPSKDAWDEAKAQQGDRPAEPELTEAEKMLALIGDQTNVPDLRKLYQRNEALIKNDETLLNAWKAKGRELSEANK